MMTLEETIRAIEVHKQRLCNQCPVKMDEPRCWDVLINEAYPKLITFRDKTTYRRNRTRLFHGMTL